jgi:hypothetical protein
LLEDKTKEYETLQNSNFELNENQIVLKEEIKTWESKYNDLNVKCDKILED